MSSKNNVFAALSGVRINELDSILFNMAIIEAVFGGIAAGKIGSGSYVAGIKHVILMIIIAVIAFTAF
jgi:flagellar protein FlaJ